MSGRKLGADALLDLVAEMLRQDIAPVLPAEKRYAAAMMGNAIDIAQREITGDTETADFALLDAVYEDGDGTMQQLARDIRAGEVGHVETTKLHRLLEAQLIAELSVRNPRLLKARK